MTFSLNERKAALELFPGEAPVDSQKEEKAGSETPFESALLREGPSTTKNDRAVNLRWTLQDL